MSFLLSSRAALLRQFYHHLGTAADDDGLTEHDATASEQALRYLQFGLWNAQTELIDRGRGERWRTTSGTLSGWQGSDSADAGRWLSLADGGAFTRFLRLAGNDESSALRTPDGTRWGWEISERKRFDVRGDYWYMLGDDQLWLARGATPPATLLADYYQRHALLDADGVAIDFPEDLTPLIAAEAAFLAIHDVWVPIEDSQQAKVVGIRNHWLEKAGRRRRTRTPDRMRARKTMGTHFWRR